MPDTLTTADEVAADSPTLPASLRLRQLAEQAALTRVMAAMECKMLDDIGDCLSCGSAPCGPHPVIWYCEQHDWHEDGNAEGVCGYALKVTRAALDPTPQPTGAATGAATEGATT